jgi:hypothetical protein
MHLPALAGGLGLVALLALPAAAAPTRDQQRCTNGLDAAAARVGKAVAATTVACVRDAAKGRLDAGGVEACIAADAQERVKKARAQTIHAVERCRVLPDFGGTDPTVINAAFTGLFDPRAFFGDDVDAAIIASQTDKAGAACQAAALGAAAKVLGAKLAGYGQCVAAGLTYGFVDSADDLIGCRGADPKGIVAKAVAKAQKATARRCAATDLATAFPGDCGVCPLEDLVGCFAHRATADLCLAHNLADGADVLCLQFVDGVADPYCGERPAAAHSMARQWNEALLDAIRRDTPRPTVHARNLFHLSIAMYDAWTAYDGGVAEPYLVDESPTTSDPLHDRDVAIAFAAYRILHARFPRSPGAAATLAQLDAKMLSLGFDTSYTTTTGSTPAAVGNRIAAAVLAYGLADGANEAGDYADNTGYFPVNDPLIVKQPGTEMSDPNRWQPLALDFMVSQNGIPIPGKVQTYISPNWNNVTPFALTRSNPDDVYLDPGLPPQFAGVGDAEFKAMHAQVAEFSGYLDPNDGVTIDISPGARGNNPLGTNDGTGHPLNPATGQPYPPNLVKRGDFARVLAEFWADGPQSETPPGHWNVLANQVADAPGFEKHFGGTGPVLEDLEWDVKTYLALNGAVHDAAIVAWGLKRKYETARPISAIRNMGGLGVLPLSPGVIEMVTAESAAPGERHEHLAAAIGKIAVYAWPGPPADPDTTVQGAHWILAESWVPYQKATFVTPAFPGFTSGHSTFSRSAAEVMTRLTGSEFFPGGVSTFTALRNEYLSFELGPSEDVVMQWATYYDAADEAGLSRIFGGIHPRADDFNGRITGSLIGIQAFDRAKTYFDGTAP